MSSYSEAALNFAQFCSKAQALNLRPDLLKSPTGNNFRAISEAAILKVINPLLFEYGIDYEVRVIENNLNIKEVGGKLVFIATCKVILEFFDSNFDKPIAYSEALGMGIDDGDKAMGKAYTYAVKYALLKKLRLMYADDPDATESKPIKGAEAPKKEEAKNTTKKEKKSTEEPLITEKMTSYIIGLTKRLSIDDETFKTRFGFYPSSDKIPMKLAREIIDTLKAEEEDLPF